MYKKINILVTIVLGLLGSAAAQNSCGTEFPGEQFEQQMQQWLNSSTQSGNRSVATLPYIVHVLHVGENVGTGWNLSATQIYSQMVALNQDMRKLNSDWTQTPAVWQPLVADCEIEFCPAVSNPAGDSLVEPGIDRVDLTTLNVLQPMYWAEYYINSTLKPLTIWNPKQYLNIWVVPFGPQKGFAVFPANTTLPDIDSMGAYAGDSLTDGIVIAPDCFGTVGNLDPNHTKGRIAAHEIGHWLGLWHLWDVNCNDYCSDTPPQNGFNTGCPAFPSISPCSFSSGNGDMFMNHMDLTNDNCRVMFTNGQKARMWATLDNSPMRVALRNSNRCNNSSIGIKENTPRHLVVYPNPSNGTLKFKGATNLRDSKLTISNIAGQMVYETTLGESEIVELPYNLTDGMYELSLQTSSFSHSQKFYLFRQH